MKYKVLILFVITLVFSGIWVACDKVDEPMTLIVDITTTDCDRFLDDEFTIDSVVVEDKQILMEEFTGHKCVNCAGASIAAHEWSETQNHRLIIYGVHWDYYATPDPSGLYTAELRSTLSSELFTDFSVQYNPTATINRTEYDGNLVHTKNNWEGILNQEIVKENVVDMHVYSIYYPKLETFEVKVKSTFLKQLDGKYRIAIYVAEDGLIAPQKNNEEDVGPAPDWIDYVHRNILRGSLSGKNGTPVNMSSEDGTIVEGEEYCTKLEYKITEPLGEEELEWTWDPSIADCNAITFIFNEESGEVIQVAEIGMKIEN